MVIPTQLQWNGLSQWSHSIFLALGIFFDVNISTEHSKNNKNTDNKEKQIDVNIDNNEKKINADNDNDSTVDSDESDSIDYLI